MGYETYLVEIRLKNNSDKNSLICNLMKRNFSLIKKGTNQYMEKKYSTGIIEICFSLSQITFRYAKPNLEQGLISFLKELQEINKVCNIELYNYHTKQVIKPEHFKEIAKSFEISRQEFAQYYSVDEYPVKSEEVLK